MDADDLVELAALAPDHVSHIKVRRANLPAGCGSLGSALSGDCLCEHPQLAICHGTLPVAEGPGSARTCTARRARQTLSMPSRRLSRFGRLHIAGAALLASSRSTAGRTR